MESVRNPNYDEISFCETDTEIITQNLITVYEEMTGRTLYPADPVRVFLLWIADIISQQNVNIDYSAKMNIPRYATGDYLDSLGDLFYDTPRLKEKKATTTLRFSIATILEEEYRITDAVQVTVDGEIIFQTTEDIVFLPGSDRAEVQAECIQAGELGNKFLPGQISKMVSEQFLYFKNVVNVTESAGGAEIEDDGNYYERMREGAEMCSTAGPRGNYIAIAKGVSAAIADVKADSPSPGIADIRVMLKGGQMPTEEMLEKIKKALSPDDCRPLCDMVEVRAPDKVEFDIVATYYISNDKTESTKEIEKKVKECLEEYVNWQTGKMGRDINPSYFNAIMMKSGIKRIDIEKPVFKRINDKEIAILNEYKLIKGQTEDE